MAYCSHCGSPTAGGRFCPACGSPLARDAVASLTADLLRRYKKMRLIVVALGLLFLVSAAWMASRVMRMERSVVVMHPAGGSAAAPLVLPTPPAQSQPAQAIVAETSTSRQQPAPQAAAPRATNPEVHPSTGSIDPQEVQRAVDTLAERSQRGDLPTKSPAASSSSGSDRYPGSQPVEVKDASLPDIGIPVASEVYTTTDPVATVVDYYRQRYPEAQFTEVEGQKIVAVNQPGATKVIAIGSSGTETRIAIVQPAE